MRNNQRIGSISVEMLAAIVIAIVIALVVIAIVMSSSDKGSSYIDNFLGLLRR